MRILFLLFFVFLFVREGVGQNLVPNPSFEDTLTCPWTFDQIDYAIGWFRPNGGSSDLFHSCSFIVPQNFFGYQNAKTGDAYAGFYTYHISWQDSSYREYISIKLIDSLEQNKTYILEFYTTLADSSNYASKLGAYFSSDSLHTSSIYNLNYIPQCEEVIAITDKIAWVKLSYQYTALGGETYLTIGNFRSDSISNIFYIGNGGASTSPDYNAAYYFVDDVSLVKDTTIGINKFTAYKEVSIYPNPTNGLVYIDSEVDFISCELVNIHGQHKGIVAINSLNEIDISENPPGIYLLYFTFEKKIIIKKIFLTH